MVHNVEAIYEHGMLRPLSPLNLAESQRDFEIMARARAEAEAIGIAPTIVEVRAALASIPGSLAEEVIAERGDF